MDVFSLNIILEYAPIITYRPLTEKAALPIREREIETVFSMGNGYIGTRNSLEEGYEESDPGTFIAGMYVQGPKDEFNFLVKTPDWTSTKIYLGNNQLDLKTDNTLKHLRYIDFELGTVIREWQNEDFDGRITDIKLIKYISLANKCELGKLLILKPVNYSEKIKIETGIDCNTSDFSYLLNLNSELDAYASIQMQTKYLKKDFAIVQKSVFSTQCKGLEQHIDYSYNIKNFFGGSYENFEWQAELGHIYIIKSLCCLNTCRDTNTCIQTAKKHIESYKTDFFHQSVCLHINKWQKRWNESRIVLNGNDYDQKLIDFAIYHLITSGEFSGDNHSIPARNLSGESYKGHVFWDTEMYLIPFFIYTKPEIARNLLMYRYNTLNGARKNALEEGHIGASFAWESTDSGEEAAPEEVILPNGEIIYILSGRYENHISPDIAYTIWKYWHASLDDEFITDYGAEIIFETARYCKSILKLGADELYHINSVIGPDEYHECINDNAYTNYLVQNNLDIAVKIYNWMHSKYSEKLESLRQKINLSECEITFWEELKNRIYTGYEPETMLYEQFKGFYALEKVDLKEYEPRSAPMDVILGQKKIKETQIIKQPDVLMFMMLFSEKFSTEQIAANYNFYEPKCGHGSSLSPSIHSIMASKAQNPQLAYDYFLKNAKIDIGDSFGNAAGGIHIASLGGTWMAVVFGFAGMQTTENGLIFAPYPHAQWKSASFLIKWKKQNLKVNLYKDKIEYFLSGNQKINIKLKDNDWKKIYPNKLYTGIKQIKNWKWKEDEK